MCEAAPWRAAKVAPDARWTAAGWQHHCRTKAVLQTEREEAFDQMLQEVALHPDTDWKAAMKVLIKVPASRRMYAHPRACTRMCTHLHLRLHAHLDACTRIDAHAHAFPRVRVSARMHMDTTRQGTNGVFDAAVARNRAGGSGRTVG